MGGGRSRRDPMMIDPAAVPELRLKQLLMVLTLAEHNSFVATAAALRTSQPVITRSLQKLERLLGVRLFTRDTRGVEITPAGRTFTAMAERALTDLRCSIGALTDSGAGHAGRVTVATFSAFAAQTLPALIGRFRETGDIVVRVLECNQGEIVEAVRAGAADFGVAYVDGLPETVTGRMLSREPLYVLLPLTHPLARRRAAAVRWEQIKDATLVSLPPDTYLRRVTDLAAAACGIQLRHPVVVERTASLINHVEAGVGIGILPRGTLPPRPWSGFHAAAVDPAVSVSVGVIVPAGRWPAYPASGLLSMIVDDFADDTPPALRAAAYAVTPAGL